MYVVVVDIPERVAINSQRRVFANGLFVMQAVYPPVRLIAWQPVLLLELGAVAGRDDSSDTELDPILILFGLLFRGRSRLRFVVACLTGTNPRDGKSSRKDQHHESARGVHNIEINI